MLAVSYAVDCYLYFLPHLHMAMHSMSRDDYIKKENEHCTTSRTL